MKLLPTRHAHEYLITKKKKTLINEVACMHEGREIQHGKTSGELREDISGDK